MSISALMGAGQDWGRLGAVQQSGRAEGFGPRTDRDGDRDAAVGTRDAVPPSGGGLPKLAQDVLGFLLQQGLGIGDTTSPAASTTTPATATTGGTGPDRAARMAGGVDAAQRRPHHHGGSDPAADSAGQDAMGQLIGAMTAALNAYAASAKVGTATRQTTLAA